jgi:hypothetical protein
MRAALAEDVRRFWATASGIQADFERLMTTTPDVAWTEPTDGDWTLADHVAHLAGWFEEGARALDAHRAVGGRWADLPDEGLDAFNDRQVRAIRGTSPADLRGRYGAGLDRLRSAIEAMTDDEWLDPEGFSWAYEDLHGHIRAHAAMIGPWVARRTWPSPIEGSEIETT